MWLTRDGHYGDYDIWWAEPKWNESNLYWYEPKYGVFADVRNAEETRKTLGLKRHLLKGKKGICEIELEIKCEVDKMKNTKENAIERAYREGRADFQQDIQSVVNMLEGDVSRQKIVNYIKEYLLDKNKRI